MAPGQRKQSEKEMISPRQSITLNSLFAIFIVAKTADMYESEEHSKEGQSLT